ncbi:hypothetical protein [Streptomyces cacaoi]|uniref:hypothetical protein n=1 Tax=Streptomyces cacaoi TaxID=1898 RepID=UPI000D1A4E0E|nr:hypothetical protein [Streptomyces cacaoi]
MSAPSAPSPGPVSPDFGTWATRTDEATTRAEVSSEPIMSTSTQSPGLNKRTVAASAIRIGADTGDSAEARGVTDLSSPGSVPVLAS